MDPESATPSTLTVTVGDEGDRAALSGALDIRTLSEAEKSLGHWPKKRKSGALDLSGLSRLDTPGALFLCGLRNNGIELTGISADHKALLDLICGLELKPLPKQASVPRWRQLVIQLGKGADDAWHDMLDVITFVGRCTSAIGHALIHSHSLRLPSISRHINPADPRKVQVDVRLRKDAPVKTDTRASLRLKGITGVVFIELNGGAPNAQSLAAVTPEGQIPEIASAKSSLTTVLDQLPKVIEKFSAIEEQTKKVMTDVGEVTGKIKDNPLLRLGAPREKPAPAPNETTAPATKEKATRSR